MSTVMGQTASVSVEIGGKEITLETGKLAKQADGAVVVRSGDTMVLVTAVGAQEPRPGADFFPLTVDVEERMYAAGKIPGGFIKRESRPSDRATLRRASSSAAAAASPTWWWLDGLPKLPVRCGHRASSASRRTGVVAALSR